MITNKFISVEGGDGVGKSTYIPYIKEYIEKIGETVVLTKEPAGTVLGELFKNIIYENKIHLLTETLLLFAARKEHIEEIIKPNLNMNNWVICDRYTDSTYAYQHAGKGQSEHIIKTLQNIVNENINPGLTFVFDLPVEMANKRLLLKKKLNKFDSESEEFKTKVNLGYKNIVKKNPTRCKLINVNQSHDETIEQIKSILDNYMAICNLK